MLPGSRKRFSRSLCAAVILIFLSSCATLEKRRAIRQEALDTLTRSIDRASTIAVIPRMREIENESEASSPLPFDRWQPIQFVDAAIGFRGFDPMTGALTDSPSLGEVVFGGLGNLFNKSLTDLIQKAIRDKPERLSAQEVAASYGAMMDKAAGTIAEALGNKCVVSGEGTEGQADLVVFVDLLGSYSVSSSKNSLGDYSLEVRLTKTIDAKIVDPKTGIPLIPHDGVFGTPTSWASAGCSERHDSAKVDTFFANWNYWLKSFFSPEDALLDSFAASVQDWSRELKSGAAAAR